MKDLKLTEDGDLYLSPDGDVEFTDSVVQAIRIRLLWFLGEWRINTTYGLPYYDEVFIKNPSPALIESRIRKEILSVEEVKKVISCRVTIDGVTRTASVSFTAELKDGETESGEVAVNV